MDILVRPYQPADYEQIKTLYQQGDLYGGQFDEDRDSAERLDALMEETPDAILVTEYDGRVCGTISLIRDARTAWLFRFAVEKSMQEKEITQALHDRALSILKSEGHKQVLVYSPSGHNALDARYAGLDFNKGGDYTCYWRPIP